ncbi:MAG: hypothetical protein GEV08_22365 [Acidimicrobiia bacterium]|nr:hypothetical protein [Acidimicrobiia bacterium]
MRKIIWQPVVLSGAFFGVWLAGTATASADSQGSGLPVVDQLQEAVNSNSTAQEAAAEATTEQSNVNAPISVLTFGSGNGDVVQSNAAATEAAAGNANETGQWATQAQAAEGDSGGHDAKMGHDGKKGDGDAVEVDQAQAAANENATEQAAEAQRRPTSRT